MPAVSVATQATTLVPIGKAEPEGGLQTTFIEPEQLSVAVGVENDTVAWHCPASVEVVMFAGQVICGGSVSSTATWKMQLAVLLELSVAVQITLLVPIENIEPGGGMQIRLAT